MVNLNIIQIANSIPAVVHLIISNPGAWLVGSAIIRLENGETPKDYDIIIEDKSELISTVDWLRGFGGDESLSKMGAHKFKINDLVIDIWHESLGDFVCKANRVSYILNLSQDVILLKSII